MSNYQGKPAEHQPQASKAVDWQYAVIAALVVIPFTMLLQYGFWLFYNDVLSRIHIQFR